MDGLTVGVSNLYVMDNVPWPNFRTAETRRIAAGYVKRSGGRNLDASAGCTYEALLVIADVLERARSTDPDAVADAIRKTDFKGGLMVAAGPIRFNAIGDHPNAGTAMIQILGQKPRVIWPKDAAEQRFVFPRPRA